MICIFACCQTENCLAQIGPFRNTQEEQLAEDLILSPPRALSRLIHEAEEAFKEERYSEGIKALWTLLSDDGEGVLAPDVAGQDYFLPAENERNRVFKNSIRGQAVRMLCELPEAGQKTLEIQLGVTANQDLAIGIEARDFQAVAEVARKYSFTKAGQNALLLMAQNYLASGSPRAAANLLQDMLSYSTVRDRFGVKLAALTTVAFRQAGKNDIAVATLKQAVEYFPNAEIQLVGRTIQLNDRLDWAATVASMSDDVLLQGSKVTNNWMISGGSPARNAASVAGLPLSNARWIERIHGSVKEEEALGAVQSTQRQENRVILPKFEVRLVNNLVLTKTTDGALFARDFETGKLLWHFAFWGAEISRSNIFENIEQGNPVSDDVKDRIWGSSSFGNISCDTERFYYVSAPNERPLSERNRSISSDNSNYLEGISLSGEGRRLWRVGGITSESEPSLAGAYFLGPPLPYESRLYVLAEFNGETRLVVLDPTNGKQLWSQQLLHTQALPIETDPLRSSQALSPTIADGVIVCPTGSAAVVAIDLLTHGLRWARIYRSQRTQATSNLAMIRRVENDNNYDPLATRWNDANLIANEGVVLLTPPESDSMFCYDLLTGDSKWKDSEIRRGSGRYIAGVNDKVVVVAADKGVYAYDYEGKPAWSQDVSFARGQTLAGKAVWLGDSLLVPLSDQQVMQIEAATGRIMATAKVDAPLGNLFAYRKQIVSVTPTAVSVYFTRESLEDDVAKRLARDPNDTWALNQKSQLLAADTSLDQKQRLELATQLLEKSLALNPEDADTRYYLVETLLRGLESDFPKYREVAQKYDSIFEFDHQRFRYLQRLALGNVEDNQHADAFQRLLDVMHLRISNLQSVQPPRRETLTVSQNHIVDSDTWIATQLARTYAAAAPQQREKMAVAIQRELSAVHDSMLNSKRQLMHYFAWIPDAHPEMVKLATQMIGNSQTDVERMLLPVLHGQDSVQKATAEQLLRDNPISDWQSMGPLGTHVQSKLSLDNLVEPINNNQYRPVPMLGVKDLQSVKAQWPSGMVNHQISSSAGYPLGMAGRVGAPMSGKQNRFGRPNLFVKLIGSTLIVMNELGEELQNISFEQATSDGGNFSRCQIEGGLILVETASELLALSLYSDDSEMDQLLWRHSLLSPSAGPNRETRLITATSDRSPLGFPIHRRPGIAVGPLTPGGVIVLSGSTLTMLDGLTGNTVWTREGLSDQVRFCAQGIELAVVDPSLGQITVLDCRDGAEIRKTPYKGDWQYWLSSGPNIVDFALRPSQAKSSGLMTESDNPVSLRIWNALSGEVAKQLDLGDRSRATVIEDRYIVALEPKSENTGELHFFDLQTGTYTSSLVPKDTTLESLQGIRFQDQLVLFSFNPREWPDGLQSAKQAAMQHNDLILACGYVYALSVDGKLSWKQPGRLNKFFIPIAQPRVSPYFAAYRMPPSTSNPRVSSRACLILVDSRDGSLPYVNCDLNVAGQSSQQRPDFSMSMNPDDHTMTVGLVGIEVRFKVTDEDRPPQPVFSLSDNRTIVPASKPREFDILGN